MSFSDRKENGQRLYKELLDVAHSFEQQCGTKPRIRILGHSHGGNVILNMAKFNTTQNINIDELVLLACPVQQATANYITHPMFKKIYSLYSRVDLLQVVDPQGLRKDGFEKPLFSERLFPKQDNLKQVEIQFNSKFIGHAKLAMKRFTQFIPTIMQEIDAWDDEVPAGANKILSIHTRKKH